MDIQHSHSVIGRLCVPDDPLGVGKTADDASGFSRQCRRCRTGSRPIGPYGGLWHAKSRLPRLWDCLPVELWTMI